MFLEDICSFLYEHIKCFLERYVKAFFAQCVTWDVISAQSNQINVSQILTMMPNICFRLHLALFVGLLRDLPKRNATECVRHLSCILLIGQSRFVKETWNFGWRFNSRTILAIILSSLLFLRIQFKLNTALLSHCPSVRPSVCPCVTAWHLTFLTYIKA